jgi:ATP phosphoribosyltransferase regulatory subunit
MTHQRWLLPEAIEDVLPAQAVRLEYLRRRLLDTFDSHGYELVMPPLLEYVESLLTGSGHDLDLRTFKLVDQLSGRSMGLRADITPQVARIDAHLLNRQGVTRLCYCGNVVHTLPAAFNGTREPLQIGLELYGHAGLEADIEVLRLLALSLESGGLAASRIDLSHVRVFRALAQAANMAPEREQELFAALQGKDLPTVRELVADVSEPARSALLALPELYGDRSVLAKAARVLPPDPAIAAALGELERLADACDDLPLSFDLADLRGYHYHSGVMFAAYAAGSAAAIALGGRYDEVGKAYGRARPATGFSMDLREFARLSPERTAKAAILAPWPEDDGLHAEAARLRASGERVVLALPGHEESWCEAGCDRILVRRNDAWCVESLPEN